MVKTIHVVLPTHLKKFFIHEYQGYVKKNGFDEIHVDKNSEIGKLIHLVSRPIPFTQEVIKPSKDTLSIRYYTHVQSFDVPNFKLAILALQLDEIFRRTIICEVRGGHELTGCEYGPLVAQCLKRRGIERDVDVDYQTIRKIYRDYITKNNSKMAKIYA